MFHIKTKIGKGGVWRTRYFVNGREVFYREFVQMLAAAYYYKPQDCGLQSKCRG